MIRTRNIYKPGENKGLYPLSRSKIDDFLKCKRCFYLDRRLGISKHSSIPFNLNNAVDKLLKKEFDNFRDRKEPHPLMMEYGIDGIPMQHPSLEIWRQNFKGVRTPVFGTDLEITGAVDDLWVNQHDQVYVVDYKATSKSKDGRLSEVNVYNMWPGYKTQAEIYQWILRHNDLNISDIAYFVYCNALQDEDDFDSKLDFKVKIIAYEGDDSWVQKTVLEIFSVLNSDLIPNANPKCELCGYVSSVDSTVS